MTQPIDYISIRRDFVDVLPFLPESAIKVFLVLVARNEAQKTLKVGLTLQELVRTADVGRHEAQRALDVLSMAMNLSDKVPTTAMPFIQILPKGKAHILAINEYWIGEKPTIIPFSFKDTDQTRIETIEREMRRLELGKVRHTESGLVEVTRGEEQMLLREIEQRGSAIDVNEAYLLGKAISRFGPDRVKSTWRKMQHNKNAIRGVYAALMKGVQGKAAKKVDSEPFQQVHYKEE